MQWRLRRTRVLGSLYSSNVVVAVTSFGLNTLCRGTDFAYRVDTTAVQAWIEDTLSPELWAQIAP